MTLLYILLAALIGICTFAVWKIMGLSKPKDESSDAKILREMIENLRRDVVETKDKLHDGMGQNAKGIQERLEKTIDLVNKQLGGMDVRMDNRVSDMNKRLDQAATLLGDVKKQYGTIEEVSRSVKNMNDAFKSPKMRGGFGERALVDMISQVLPMQSYEPQHKFKTGDIVDLLVKTSNGSICIDAKFPLENFSRLVATPEDEAVRRLFVTDVKKHIKDISKKYILPDEGTLEFALMYVPSDAVMYEILANAELSSATESQRVFILSPHSFYYFLDIIRLAYQSQQFEENAKKVLGLIRGIQQQSGKLEAELTVLQNHINNANNKMGSVQKEFSKLDSQIDQTSLLEESKTTVIEKIAEAKTKEVVESLF